MHYLTTHRTYDPSDCASVGFYIRANKNCVTVKTRSCWQGSRQHAWTLRGLEGKGLELAKEMANYDPTETGQDFCDFFGLADDDARIGPAVR